MELIAKQAEVAPSSVQAQQNQFVTFWINEELFGVDILAVKEVSSLMEITPVFQAPAEVKGYMNIRGEIHLVIDLRVLLGIEEQKSSSSSKIIIFNPEVAKPFGILVDKVGDVLDVDESKIAADAFVEGASSNESLNTKLINGVCKLEDRLMILLDPYKFLNS